MHHSNISLSKELCHFHIRGWHFIAERQVQLAPNKRTIYEIRTKLKKNNVRNEKEWKNS